MAGTGEIDCPGLETLESFCRDATSGEVADHVRRCPRCRDLVGDLRRNNELMERLAALGRGDERGS